MSSMNAQCEKSCYEDDLVYAERTSELLDKHMQAIYKRTDRMFVRLMVLQYLGAIVTAFVITPRTWYGSTGYIHPHVYAAIFLGGIATFLPMYLVAKSAGKPIARYSIGICQVLMSSLLIHLTGGRIETHFHIFGSLAFWHFIATGKFWYQLLPL